MKVLNDLSNEEKERVEALWEAFEEGREVEVNRGPMEDGVPVLIEVDYIDELVVDVLDTPEHDLHVRLRAELNIPHANYEPYHSKAVYAMMEEFGIERPSDTPFYGVQIGNPITIENYISLE